MEGRFIPQEFLTKFEILKLNFSKNFGFINNVTKKQSQMIITFLLIIKVMIINVIFQPYQWSSSINKTSLMIKYYSLLSF